MNRNAKLTSAMEAHKWRKGQPSPNPTGRPKRAPISDAYASHLGEPLPDEIRSRLKLPDGATWANAIALGQIRSALKGNTVAAKEIADRVEGRVRQPVEVATPEGGEIRVEIVHIGSGKEWSDESKQAGSEDSAAIKPEPR